jgi:hypothetical protein
MDSHAAKHHSPEGNHPEALHEVSTVQVKPVILFAVILAVTALATFATVKILLDYLNFNYTRTDPQLSPLANPDRLPPTPRLEVASGQNLRELRSREATSLKGYYWVNKDLGVVGIPVERAIELLAQRGLPAREETKPTQ